MGVRGTRCLCFFCVVSYALGYMCQCPSPEQCQYCRPVGSCKERNVALGKQTKASSLYTSTRYGNSGPACLAVDGNTDTDFEPISWNPNYPQCVHTAGDDHSPYWEVDLGQPYVINNIIIYGRTEDYRNTVRDANVAVDDTVCYSFPSDYRTPVVVNISSNLPLTGSKVKVFKVNVSAEPFMALCEVQVWVNCADNGFYGPQCLECGHCKEETCDADSGNCQNGCNSGWKGGNCDQACDFGFYGSDCQMKCGKCRIGYRCDSVNGSCPFGCQTGYQSQYCTESCTAGSYGDGCNSVCGNCKNTRECNTTTGSCPDGCLDVHRRSNFLIRSFDIKMRESSDKKRVEQYHYLAWPDHGVPATTSLLNFWRFAKAPQRPPPPILVHCTAGVGRTKTFIGLDIAYENAVAHGEVSVYDVVQRMRTECCIMVQAEDQYVFLHKALLEAYTGRDTTIPNDQFEQTFPEEIKAENENTRIDREFQTVMQMRSLAPEVPGTIAKIENNIAKITNQDALPGDEQLVSIQDPKQNQFINAVFMPTYKEHQGSIMTQLPLQQTLADFWKLVDQCDVRTIVNLGHENEHTSIHDYCQYWPKEPGTTIKGASSREVQLLHYTDWAGELPGNTSQLLQLIDSVESLRLREKKPLPVVIQCLDGVTRSGLFCALCNVLSRLSSDKKVDVYMAVREVHTIRPQAIASVAQYRYCYQVAQQRLREISVYANT